MSNGFTPEQTPDDNLGLPGTESFLSSIPHYYGDAVRQLFLAAAALILVSAPFYANLTPFSTMTQVFGALVLAVLAAFTSPRLRLSLLLDACVAGVGLLIYETAAINGYASGDLIIFIIRQTISILFLFALYNSIKTLRSMLSHRVSAHARSRAARIAAEAAEVHAEEMEEQAQENSSDKRPEGERDWTIYND